MRAGGIQERNYQLYGERRAVSSPILDELNMLRYNRDPARKNAARYGRIPLDGFMMMLMTGVEHPAIRTPDQRLRVFVSSTLRELADERRAARAAIERMRLAPVMFELGARPHPPRDLYRSYLA